MTRTHGPPPLVGETSLRLMPRRKSGVLRVRGRPSGCTQRHLRRRTPMDRYIGLDVHAASTTFAVVGPSGKRLGTHVVETNGPAVIEQLKRIAGQRHVCLEAGTQSTWMHEILSPHAEQVVVIGVAESRGLKSDQRDAYGLAERLGTGAIERQVFKQTGAYTKLRELARMHTMIVQDVVRVQNRIKALYRSRGIAVAGQTVYSVHGRQGWLPKLPEAPRWDTITLYPRCEGVQEDLRKDQKDLVQKAHRHQNRLVQMRLLDEI